MAQGVLWINFTPYVLMSSMIYMVDALDVLETVDCQGKKEAKNVRSVDSRKYILI